MSSFGEKTICSHNVLPVLGDIQREIMSSDLLRLSGSHIPQRKKIKAKLDQCMDMKVIKLYNQRCLDLEGNVEVISVDIHGMNNWSNA